MAAPHGSQSLGEWRARYGFRAQSIALIVIVVGSLILYAVLQAGLSALAVLCFAAIAVSMAIVIWIT
jgi:hypothetical protein